MKVFCILRNVSGFRYIPSTLLATPEEVVTVVNICKDMIRRKKLDLPGVEL